MARTSAEQLQKNNPFRAVEAAAKMLMRRCTDGIRLQFVDDSKQGGYGALDRLTLSLYGNAKSRSHAVGAAAATDIFGEWALPTSPGQDPGRVSQIDISRRRSFTPGSTQTDVTFLGSPINPAGSRYGIHVKVDATTRGEGYANLYTVRTQLYDSRAELARINVDPVPPPTMALLDQGYPEAVSHEQRETLLPLVTDCARILGELAAGTEAQSGVKMPLYQMIGER